MERKASKTSKGDAQSVSPPGKQSLAHEFKDFLKEYRVLSLAIAFIIGQASTGLVQSMVSGIIMPLITPLMPAGDWEKAIWIIGPFKIAWGPFVAAAINFLIIAVFVFLVAKLVLKEEKVTRK